MSLVERNVSYVSSLVLHDLNLGAGFNFFRCSSQLETRENPLPTSFRSAFDLETSICCCIGIRCNDCYRYYDGKHIGREETPPRLVMHSTVAANASRLRRNVISPIRYCTFHTFKPRLKACRTTSPLVVKSSWSYKKAELDIAKTNALLRKCDIAEVDFARLEALRPRIEELIQQKQSLTSEMRSSAQDLRQQDNPKDKHKEEKVISSAGLKYKGLKEASKKTSYELDGLYEEAHLMMMRLPNLTHPDVPIGGEEEATMIGKGGDSRLIDKRDLRLAFEKVKLPQALKDIPDLSNVEPDLQRDHLDVALRHGWIDRDAMSAVAGSGWPVLQGSLALLEHALVAYGMDIACKAGFRPVVVPDVVKTDLLDRTGFQPRQGGGGQTYWLSVDGQKEESGLALAATAEIPLAGMCSGLTYTSEDDLPVLHVASSHAFRAEAGARGKESRGLYRVHQFTKVELFVVSQPAQSHNWLERLRKLQEEIIGGLLIPYRVLDMPTEELGASAFRKYDIEAWMPGRGKWGEISSASNCTEYQARRLGIKYKDASAQKKQGRRLMSDYVHTLNGTAVAVPRLIVALLENYGVSKEGKMRLPAVLSKYCFESAQDQFEWIGSPHKISTKTTALQNALARIRSMSQKTGTDTASMIISFMILHELTAIIPLILLFHLLGLLGVGEQVMAWLLKVSGDEEDGAKGWLRSKIDEGMQRAESYGRKKGYFGFEAGSHSADVITSTLPSTMLAGTFANAVAAYAITKALFPLRIAACIALAGPFARVFIEPVKRIIARRRAAKHL